MRIISLTLENIKSYVSETINFNDGINCILGKNGSGKSTIIESIGYVLFNYNQDNNKNSLLRYNETKGSISIVFEADDGIRYEIIRKINRNSGSVRIKRVDTGEVLQENVSNVYSYVRKILKIAGGKTLANLFKEIIAVPQGTFVSAFLDTSTNRKTNFDSLFELDIYKKLADDVKKVNDKVEKEHIYILNNEIANLDGKLSGYDKKKADLDKITLDKDEKTKEYNRNNELYNKKNSEKEKLDGISKKYDDLINNYKDEKNNLSILTNKKTELEKAYNKAKASLDIVKDNEFGYNVYTKNNNELEENTKKSDIVKDGNKQISLNNNTILGNNNQIEVFNNDIHDLKVNRGVNLEKIGKLENEIKDLNKELKEEREKLTPLREKISKLHIDNLKRISEINDKYNKLDNIYNSVVNFNKDKTPQDYEDEINELSLQLKEISEINAKIIELDKEKVLVTKDLENLNSNEKYMKGGLCPILKQECLNMKNKSLDCELTNLIKQDEDRLREITSEIIRLTALTSSEEEITKNKNALEINKNMVIGEYERYKTTINQLKQLFPNETEIITEENDIDIIKELYTKYSDLKDNYENSELDELRKEESSLSTLINNNDLKVGFDKQSINTITLENEKIQNNIDSKNNEVVRLTGNNKRLEDENTNINLELLKYKNVEIDIENNKAMINKFKPNYEIYMANLNESLLVSEKEKEVKDNEEEITLKLNLIKDLDQNLKDLDKQFDKDRLNKLIEEINELSNKNSSLLTTIEIYSKEIEEKTSEIKELDILKKEKTSKEKEKDKYEELSNKLKMYRKVYIDLPKELSEHIRKYIATYATTLYRHISNENVKIEIKDDYEVVIIDCSDNSKLKRLSQLSGGEQMSVAISIRLAMLKHITNVDLYFMDEPTVNLDIDRRRMVADVVKDISHELTQIFVISHDDTFEEITDSAIKIDKEGNISYLDR